MTSLSISASAFSQESKMLTFLSATGFRTDLLRLQAAGHAVLVHAAAAVLLTRVAYVMLRRGSLRVTTATDQQVLPATHVPYKTVRRSHINHKQ